MNKPDIRFNGFNGEWEEKKINEISEINPHSELPVQFEYVDLESVTGTEMVSHRTERLESAPSRAQRLAQKGDIFYQTVRPYQKNNYYFNLDEKDYVFSTGYAQLRSKLDGNFFLSVLQSDKFVADVLENCTGTSYPAINPTTLGNLKVAFPDNAEQKKLGALFSQIDSLISSTKKEQDKLVALKKCMLQKMFPKKGSLVPEIRFKGFSGDWKLLNWKDVVNISTEMVNPQEEVYQYLPHIAPGNIESFTGLLHDNVKIVKDENLISGKFHFYKNDIIYGKINPQLGKYYFSTCEGLTSADAYVLNAKDDFAQDFLYVVIQTKDFFKYSVSVSKRSGMPKINRNQLNGYSFMAPSLPEQQKIGSYFQNLDNLISKQSAELEKLKNVKKTLLSKMFV